MVFERAHLTHETVGSVQLTHVGAAFYHSFYISSHDNQLTKYICGIGVDAPLVCNPKHGLMKITTSGRDLTGRILGPAEDILLIPCTK